MKGKLNPTILLFILGAIILLFFQTSKNQAPKEPLPALMMQKLEDCQSQTPKEPCLKDLAQTLSKNYELAEIFSYVEANENNPVVFANCHSTMHFLGQATFEKEKTFSKTLSSGSPVCFAGFYHGVLEGYLQSENIGPQTDFKIIQGKIPSLCQKDSLETQKNYNECLHGLGHALMYITDGELPEALSLCDTLIEKNDQNWCYSGSFMENSTSSTNFDHPSKYLRENDLLYPCSTLEEKYLQMCYTLQGFYFAEISNYDFEKVAKLCLEIPQNYQTNCFDSIGQTLVGYTQDPQLIKTYCLKMPQDYINSCIGGAAGAMSERFNDGQTRKEQFCQLLQSIQKNACLSRK